MKSTNGEDLRNQCGMITDARKVLLTSLLVVVVVLFFLGTGEENRVYAQGPIGATVGIPWHGAPGVTETVAQIMARERSIPQKSSAPKSRVRRRAPRPIAAPKSSQPVSPIVPAAASLAPARNNPQPIGTSFLGVQISESGFYPPDTMGDVGPTQILFVENGLIKSFSKSGGLGALDSDLDLFFGSLSPGAIGTGDVNVRYDRLSGRWFVTALDFDSPTRLFIAVSSSATITNATGFTFFQFQTDQVGGTPNPDTGADADYDSLGVDKYSLYIGVNMFGASSLVGTTGFVVNKADLLAGTLTVTAFRALVICNPSCSNGPLSPRGVANDDPAATEGYFIGVDIGSNSLLTLRRVTYTLGITPTISGNIFVPISTTVIPIPVPALGSTTPIDAVGNDLFNAQVHKNKLDGVSSLWTAHNIDVVACGNSVSGGGRDGSRWYEITNLTTTPTLNQFGTLFDPATSNPRSFWMPTVAMSGQGHMSLGSSFASVNDYAGIAVAGRFFTDPLGAIQSPTIAQNGLGSYNVVEPPSQGGRNRWGDYSRTVVDPNDNMTMWTFQEYANATNSWGVRAIQLKAPPPEIPMFATPSSVPPGQPSVNVIITGASISGSGFFDPGPDTGGPGFANHIAATLTGGVTVNSVTFSSPTLITLNISTIGATPGAQSIIVTNPDGQTSTGYCVLTISGSSTPPMCRQFFPFIAK
jgi:hypothetical protein